MTLALATYDPLARAVLVLSGDAAMRRSLDLLLRAEGYRVAAPAIAGAAAPPGPPAVGCVVLDQSHHATAAEVLQLAGIVARHREAELILLADDPAEPVLAHAAELRLLAVLRKPLLDDSLVRWVDRALARAALRADQRS